MGDDKIACEEALEKAYKELLEDCKPPTECEKRSEAIYAKTFE